MVHFLKKMPKKNLFQPKQNIMQNNPIGILSGTFDPIHLGHMHLATMMLQTCNLKKIIFIPCAQSPLRKPPIASSIDRFNMVKLAIAQQNNFVADDREIKQGGISYTIKTLESLRQEYQTPLALILGSDVFNRFLAWYAWQKILATVHLLVAKRPGTWEITNQDALKLLHQHQTVNIQQLQNKISGLIYVTDINPLPIAATKVRTLINTQQDASSLVAPAVWQYICNKQLYI